MTKTALHLLWTRTIEARGVAAESNASYKLRPSDLEQRPTALISTWKVQPPASRKNRNFGYGIRRVGLQFVTQEKRKPEQGQKRAKD